MTLALVASRDGKVTGVEAIRAARFEGWFIRALHACKGAIEICALTATFAAISLGMAKALRSCQSNARADD